MSQSDTAYPSSFPTSFNWSQSETNTSFPSFQPTVFNGSAAPTFMPTRASNASRPTAPPQAYNLIEDVTNPKKFNFLALALSLSLLLIVVSVTLYGFCQRYAIVQKRTLARYKYRRSRASTPERFQMYFDEDAGPPEDRNSFSRGIYAGVGHNLPEAEVTTARPPTGIIGLRPTKINSP